jgi:D-glycero-D-manno-heptose 1,7-bisphosphate phosphatase
MTGPGAAAVFLDRDGTLNVEKNYMCRYEDWEWIPGVVDGLKKLVETGFLLVIVSNQSGVARGYFSKEDVDALHLRVERELQREGVPIAGFYYCPHGPDEGCACRKPAPGMIVQASRALHIDLSRSYLVGDKAVDVEAGVRAGVQPLLVTTGYGKKQRGGVGAPVPVVRDLASAADWIVSNSMTRGV